MRKSTNIRAARKAAQQRKYAALVVDAFDRIEHAERRERRDEAAKVRRDARNRL